MGLSHIVQHAADAVLRRHLQLAADVIVHQLLEEVLVLVLQHIVIPHAAADEHLLDAGDPPHPLQKLCILAVVGVQILAGLRRQAGLALAHAVLLLLTAGGMAEVGAGAAHIVDVALEPGIVGQQLRLRKHRLDAAGGDHPPLMEGQGAEIAPAEAAAVVYDRELDLLDGRNAAERLVHRVILLGVRKLGHAVKLLCLQRHRRGIYDEVSAVVLLYQRPAAHGVVLGVFYARCIRIKALAVTNIGKRGQRDRVKRAFRRIVSQKRSAADIAHLGNGDLLFKPLCYLALGVLCHAVNEHVRTRINENRAAHLVVPIVIVRKAP